LDGSLDFIVGPRPAQPLPEPIATEPLIQFPSALVVRRGHALERAHSIKDFIDAEWVLSSAAAHAESALHRVFARAGLPGAKIAVRVESLWAAISFVSKTEYVGLFPRYPGPDFLFDRISYVDVPELEIIDSYEIFLRREVPLSTAATHLVADIKLQARRARERSTGPGGGRKA